MIAAEYLVVYRGMSYLVEQSFGHDKVVDTPSGIFLACLKSVRPPRVGSILGMQPTECIHKTIVKEACHFGAFLVGKASVLAVGLGVL